MDLQPFVVPWPLFSFLILHTGGRTPWTGISPLQGLYLHTEQHEHRINAYNPDISVLSRIRAHDPSVPASEDSSCLGTGQKSRLKRE
jgi:hypothetical protein